MKKILLVLTIIVMLSGLYLLLNKKNTKIKYVFLITLDTTRADRLVCYGYEQAHTPFLDAFAHDRAVLFQNAITWLNQSAAALETTKFLKIPPIK